MRHPVLLLTFNFEFNPPGLFQEFNKKKTFSEAILTEITRGRPCAMGKKFPNAKGY